MINVSFVEKGFEIYREEIQDPSMMLLTKKITLLGEVYTIVNSMFNVDNSSLIVYIDKIVFNEDE